MTPTQARSPATTSSSPPGARRVPRRRLPRILSVYVGTEILKVFLLVFFILEIIHGSTLTIKGVRDFGFDLILLLPVLWISFAYALYHAIPIALLFGTSLVFGRLVADREITAFRGFGLSYGELLIAPATIGVVFSLIGFVVNGYVVPQQRFAWRNIGNIVLDQLQHLGDGWNKKITLGRANTIHIGHYAGRKLYNISIYAEKPEQFEIRGVDPEESEPGAAGDELDFISFPFILHAQVGEVINSLDTAVADGDSRVYFELRGISGFFDPGLISRKDRADFLNPFILDRFRIPIGREDRDRNHPKDMINPVLREKIGKFRGEVLALEQRLRDGEDVGEELERSRDRYLRFWSEYHRRLTFAAISFIFSITAALLAFRLNSTNRLLPFFVSVVVNCVIFFPLEVFGNKLGRTLGAPWFFAQLGNVALLALALVVYLGLEHRLRPGPHRRSRVRRARGEAG